MKKLHHKAKRYEVQIYDDTSLAWKPIAHYQAKPFAIIEAVANGQVGKRVRVLDRLNRKVEYETDNK